MVVWENKNENIYYNAEIKSANLMTFINTFHLWLWYPAIMSGPIVHAGLVAKITLAYVHQLVLPHDLMQYE